MAEQQTTEKKEEPKPVWHVSEKNPNFEYANISGILLNPETSKEVKEKYQQIMTDMEAGKILPKEGKTNPSANFTVGDMQYGLNYLGQGSFSAWRRKATAGGGTGGGAKPFYRTSDQFVGSHVEVQKVLKERANEFWNYQESFDNLHTNERNFIYVRKQKWTGDSGSTTTTTGNGDANANATSENKQA